jgi:hypothetical protein
VASGSLLLSEQRPGGKTDLSHPEKSETRPFNLFNIGFILTVNNRKRETMIVEDLDSFLQFFSWPKILHIKMHLQTARVRKACRESTHWL